MSYELTTEVGAEYLRATVTGTRTVEHVLRAVRDVVDACAAAKREKALVDVRGLAGSLDTLDSYEIPAAGFAAVKRPGVVRQAAIVDRKDRERGFKFFETVLEVIYTGLRQTPEQIVQAAIQEGVDVIAMSVLSGAHDYLFPRVMELLKDAAANDILVIGGGIIPEEDIPPLKKVGIRAVFGPGTPTTDIIRFIEENVSQ